MSTGEVLNAIDQALHDWDVSPDAMRCKPPVDDVAIQPTWQPPYIGPPIRIQVRPEDFAPRPGALVPGPEPYAASRRQVRPLLDELGRRIFCWLLRRRR